MTIITVAEKDYRQIRDLIFDQQGNYDPAVAEVHSAFGRPFDIMFREVPAATAFLTLCTSAGIEADCR